MHLKEYPPSIKVNRELIFISKEFEQQLKEFADRNQIKCVSREANWNYLTEPFLDTEFDEKQQEATKKLLNNNGFTDDEIRATRATISKQMYKYNFDTMLWEWGFLGFQDVLSAMRPKFSKEEFRAFYWSAMEMEQRSLLPLNRPQV